MHLAHFIGDLTDEFVEFLRVDTGALRELFGLGALRDAVDAVGVRGDILDLISLDLPDKVPADVVWQRRSFVAELLGIRLAEVSLSSCVGL